MLDQAIAFVLDVVFGLFTYAFLLRFAMQWLRAPFRNPVGQSLVALTDWAVKPVRRVLPGLKGLDWATLRLLSGLALRGGVAFAVFALVAVVELVKAALWLLIVVVFVQAILSWVAPDGPVAGLLNALTWKFLTPIRRRIPPLGGTVDLSPLIVIVLAQLALMLPVRWLEMTIPALFR